MRVTRVYTEENFNRFVITTKEMKFYLKIALDIQKRERERVLRIQKY